MNINDYKFNVGDEVITIFGKKGKIIDICDCEECRKRGFLEPVWRLDTGNPCNLYITKTEAENGFDEYYKIGKYRFNDFDKDTLLGNIRRHEREIKAIKELLEFMDNVEKGENNELEQNI